MRIAFMLVKHPVRGGGIESFTYQAGRRLAQRGHEVVVYSMGHYGEMMSEIEGVQIVRVPCLPGTATERLSGSMMAALMATMGKRRFDVIHCHTPMTGAFAILPRMFGIPAVLQLHGIDWKRVRWGALARNVILFLERIAFPVASACTAVSREQCEFYESRYRREVQYISTGAELPAVATNSDQIRLLGLGKKQYILFLARLVPEKGAHYLIRAFRRMKTDLPLVIAGVGDRVYEESLRKLADGDGRIRFPGYVDGDLKQELLSHAQLFVQPSDLEGLSISLLEAMSYGICCLASDLPANREALGNAGVYFQKSDEESMVAALANILSDENRRDSLGDAAAKRATAEFSWEHTTRELEQLYLRIVNVPGRALPGSEQVVLSDMARPQTRDATTNASLVRVSAVARGSRSQRLPR